MKQVVNTYTNYSCWDRCLHLCCFCDGQNPVHLYNHLTGKHQISNLCNLYKPVIDVK